MRKSLPILLSLAATSPALAQPGAPIPTPTPTPTPAPAPDPQPPLPPQPDVRPPDPAPVAPKPEEKKPNAGFDKGFFIRNDDGKYTMKITGRVQPFYTLTRVGDTDAAGATVPKDYKGSFEVRRARLVLEGNIHTKKLLYKMQSDFGKGYVTLKDFHADVEL